MKNNQTSYKKICLKLTGEAFSNEKESFSLDSLNLIFKQIEEVLALGVSLAVVLGGGNIVRGEFVSTTIASRSTRDYVGMFSTIMNAMILKDFLQSRGFQVILVNSFDVPGIAERKINLDSEFENPIVLFSGGVGYPFFTTDTAAVLRSLEFQADILIKGTKVKGVYNKDPIVYSDAKIYSHCSYNKILEDNLKVMDLTAITLAQENNLKIGVIDFFDPNALISFLKGKDVGTLISITE